MRLAHRGNRQASSHAFESYELADGGATKTWASFPQSRARSTVEGVPLELPSQKATRTSHASTRRWLRAADRPASDSSSKLAGITCTGIPLARAAFVAPASTPLALPVMIDARGGSAFT